MEFTMHYYKFDISTWYLATNHLTLEEEAIYFRLLNYYYHTEQIIPKETQSVIRKLRLGNYMDTVNNILNEFFTLETDGWRHEYCDSVIDAFHNKATTNRKNGNLGGRPRKIKELDDNPQKTQSVLSDNPKETLIINNELEIINNKLPIKKQTKSSVVSLVDKFDSDFDLFWIAYPKKVGKEAARKAWKKERPNLTIVLQALDWQRESKQWTKDNGQYIPNPATYLNQGRWQDEPEREVLF